MSIQASPETVFAFFTDPGRMVQWMGVEATLDPRPGGIFRVAFEPPGPVVDYMRAAFGTGAPVPGTGAHVVLGEFVEVEPYRRIAFTWGFETKLFAMPPQSTAVEVSFTPERDGTLVRLAHRRLPQSAAGFHRAGWEHYMPRLVMVAVGRDPGTDPWQAHTY
ncbi:MAG: SRPBCC domain-containing protein [Gaiellaceae bacterium]